MNKSLLIKNAVLLNPELKAEDLEKQNASQIATVINTLETARRTHRIIKNPALPINDRHTIVEGQEINDKDNTAEIKTMLDYQNIVNNLLNK